MKARTVIVTLLAFALLWLFLRGTDLKAVWAHVQNANLALGLRRAMRVRNILVEAGLPAATVDVTSHGEADQLVKTRDNTPEPRNRRVGITVR